MTLLSRLRYLGWRAAPFGRSLKTTLLNRQRLILRPAPADDLEIAYEVFVAGVYRSPRTIPPRSVHRIVDVGANVGYTVVYWAEQFPVAHIEAFEPHPEHLCLLAQNVHINNLEERVTVRPVAAGVEADSAYLVDAGSSSKVIKQNRHGAISIQAVDFFEAIGTEPIDLLKLDCEGSEYALLMDGRFKKLKVETLVVEWDATPEHPHADHEIAARLQHLGRSLYFGGSGKTPYGIRAGIIWAYKESVSNGGGP
jgi:FkbM family methyltransferase